VDCLLKQAIFISTHDTITLAELACLFIVYVFSKHGVLSHVMSDRSFKFVVRRPLTHDPRAPPIASQHNFIVQPLVTKEWNTRAF